jgi:Uma2 family endonuclease
MFKDFIKGSLVLFPSPTPEHEGLKGNIFTQISVYLKGSSNKVYDNISISLGSYLPQIKDLEAFQKYFKEKIEKGTEKNASLIPDIFVVCAYDRKDFNSYGYIKPPKMVIEIASPSTARNDLREKFDLYEFIGVEEYWVIHDEKNVSVFLLENGKYEIVEYSIEDDEGILEVPIKVLDGLKIKIQA